MHHHPVYTHSPFSIKTIAETQNRALLLQFILSELVSAKEADKKDDPVEFVFSSPACFFPYDWSYEMGCLNKIHEHATLLQFAFPKLKKEVEAFNFNLEETLSVITEHKKREKKIPQKLLLSHLKNLYLHLYPVMIACKDNEGLLLFLLKNQEALFQLSYPEDLTDLFSKMYPEGLDILAQFLKSEYKKRGFTNLLPEIDRLLESYEK